MYVYDKLWLAPRLAFLFAYGHLFLALDVLHSCDIPNCVNPAHLWQGTNQDNMTDMVAKQRGCFGEKNIKAKLSDADVLEIRARERGRRGFITALSNEFNVTRSTINRVLSGKLWRHLLCL